jgi:hypothetical protein
MPQDRLVLLVVPPSTCQVQPQRQPLMKMDYLGMS